MDIIQKGNNRLASWKSKVLSMAGRLTLIQSVTSAVPIYAMQITKLRAIVCQNLDKLNRNFLWCDSDIQGKEGRFIYVNGIWCVGLKIKAALD